MNTEVQGGMVTKDLSAAEASEFAAWMWSDVNLRTVAQKLIYFALAKNEKDPVALTVLVRYLDAYATDDKVLALADHALKIVTDPRLAKPLQETRQVMLHRLGLLRAKSMPVPAEPWQHTEAFQLDEERYASIINPLLSDNGNRLLAACRLLIGLHGNAINHISMGRDVPSDKFEEFYYPDRFIETQAYAEFLADHKFRADGARREDDELPVDKWYSETEEFPPIG